MKLTENAERVLLSRYYTKNEKGEPTEDWKSLCKRVCNAVASPEENSDAEKWAQTFFEMMYSLDFLPNSPTMFNAGKEKGMLSACFVLDIQDSMQSIMKTLSDSATIFKCISGKQKMFAGETVKLAKDLSINDYVYISDGSSRRVLDKIPSGKKDIYRLTTDSGYTIECTKDHKILSLKNLGSRSNILKRTVSCFEEIQNLTKKDAVQISIPSIYNIEYRKIYFTQEVSSDKKDGRFKVKTLIIPKIMNEDLAWVIGFFIGDGSYHRDGIRFSVDPNGYSELIETLKEWCKSINSDFSISQVRKDSSVVEFSILRKNLKELFVSLIGKDKLVVPQIIVNSPKTVKEAFLRGLFDADGTVLKEGYASYCTCNSTFAKEIQDLLLSVGIYSKLYHRDNDFQGHNIVSIKSKESHNNFVKYINSSTIFKSKRLKDNKPKWKNGNYLNFEHKKWDTIKSIERIGQEQTFNFTIDDVHEYNSMGIISKNSGGGVGINFSDLRPENAPIKSTGGTSSGPISFMRMFDTMTEVVKQGGKRRGALMGMLDIDHPDAEKFIEAKIQEGKLSNFNISVAVTDEFMNKVKAKEDNALRIWSKIIDGAWKNGEPGIVFMDTINADNPVPHLGRIKCSNPCGEYFFIPFGSCNLGSINLSNMVKDGAIDWEKYEKTIRQAVRFLDNVITINHYPIPEIKDITTRTRPVGLGIMGFADLLLKLGIRYDSSEGIDSAQEVMEFLQEKAWDESSKLGKEKGSFPEFKKTKFTEKFEALRNCQLSVIAPTGTLSLIAGCSSGIEPNFSWHTQMHRIGTVMEEYHPLAFKYLKGKEKLPQHFVTSSEISPEWHVRMQAAFQVYTDNAISKTCNAPKHATKSDVHKLYMLAWELKCKGVTYYRESSRTQEVLVKGDEKAKEKNQRLVTHIHRDREDQLEGITRKVKTNHGNSYITINFDIDGYPLEVFNQASAKIPCNASSEGLARMTSLALREGISIERIIKQLNSARCSSGCVSCPDVMGQVLSDVLKKRADEKKENECPECKAQLETSEGCLHCPKCGWGRCSM